MLSTRNNTKTSRSASNRLFEASKLYIAHLKKASQQKRGTSTELTFSDRNRVRSRLKLKTSQSELNIKSKKNIIRVDKRKSTRKSSKVEYNGLSGSKNQSFDRE